MFLDSFNSEPNSFTAPTTLGHRQEETDDVNFHKYIYQARAVRTYVEWAYVMTLGHLSNLKVSVDLSLTKMTEK